MPIRIDLFARSRRRFACLATLAVVLFGLAPAARATFYQVNSPADVPDANTQTTACETATGNGICTLRAAVQQANAHAGLDTILVPANTYVLSRVGDDSSATNGDLDVTGDVTIIGAGAATTIIDGNSAVTGDRVFQLIGSIKVSMSGLTIQHGAAVSGGGIDSQADLTIDHCIITGNSSTGSGDRQGGGIDSTGSLVLKNSIVSDNTAEGVSLGGGIHGGGPVTISDSTISGNTGDYDGGGVMVENDAAITNSTFSGNHALYGGGIYTRGTTILINDTISGNSSDSTGGGINTETGTVGLYSTTVAGNVANADKSGGGSGGGMYNFGASVTLSNSILAGNYHLIDGSQFIALSDCAGTLASSGNNIVTAPTCTINGPHSADAPKLGPLQDNGGPTLTHALLPGSPALDASTCVDPLGAPLATDQRGVPRPQGAACDLGAFELEDLIFTDGFDPGT